MSQFLGERYRNLVAYVPGEQPRDMDYIKLNTNESPFPPAPAVVDAINRKQVELLRLYSDPTCLALRQKLAGLHGLEAENVFVSNGSDDALNFIFMAYGQRGAIFPDITYGFYKVYADLHQVEYTEIPLAQDFSVDVSQYKGWGQLVVIANPNAPTGICLGLSEIENILVNNPRSVVAIDEAYVDFGGESCYSLIKEYENLLVVRTYSKSRNLAGGRLGYVLGNKDLIQDLEKLKYSTNPYCINRLTMILGETTVDEEQYYRECCQEVIKVRETTRESLERMGFQVLPSKANFLFARHAELSGEDLYLKLKAGGILVRHFDAKRIRDFLRITIGTEQQMEQFICTLEKIIREERDEKKSDS